MNKATLTSTINGFLTAVITQLKHRNSILELINALFQTTYTMQVADATDTLSYKINFKKIGNIVYVEGYIKNGFSSMLTPEVEIITIGNSLYFGKTGNNYPFLISNVSTYTVGLISVSADAINLESNLGAGSKVTFNAHYQTND